MEKYVERLLHIEEEDSNKFIDLSSPRDPSFFLSAKSGILYELIRDNLGKISTVALRDSAEHAVTKQLGDSVKLLDWFYADEERKIPSLHKFKDEGLDFIRQKGTNPMFLSLGAIRWEIVGSHDEIKEVLSPLIIFPIKLTCPGDKAQPVYIEFVNDQIFFNPSFLLKLEKTVPGMKGKLPLPVVLDDINTDAFDITDYFDRLETYITDTLGDNTEESRRLFAFERDAAAIAKYNNRDICMYHDIRRNETAIKAHPLIRAVFGKQPVEKPATDKLPYLATVFSSDCRQHEIITRAVTGENLVVQGPPGTGKTQTIANLISAYLAQGKRVLFVSQKIAALSEVYNKMPDSLRPYLLRMDYETESSRIDVNTVHSELHDTLLKTSPVTNAVTALADRESVYRKLAVAKEAMSDYAQIMFKLPLSLSGPLYGLLDEYCRNLDAETVDFDTPERCFAIDYGAYAAIKDCVAKINTLLARLTDGHIFPLGLNPWVGLMPATEGYDGVYQKALALTDGVNGLLSALGVYAENHPARAEFLMSIDCRTAAELTDYDISPEQTRAFLKSGTLKEAALEITALATAIIDGEARIAWLNTLGGDALNADAGMLPALKLLKLDRKLPTALCFRIAAAAPFYDKLMRSAAEQSVLKAAWLKYRDETAAAFAAYETAVKILDEKKFAGVKRQEALIACYKPLEKYDGCDKPKTLDLFAKAAYGKIIKKYARHPEFTSFKEACGALKAFTECTAHTATAQAVLQSVKQVIKTEITEADAEDFLALLGFTGGYDAKRLESCLQGIFAAEPVLRRALKAVGVTAEQAGAAEGVIAIYETAALIKEFGGRVEAAETRYGFKSECDADADAWRNYSRKINALARLQEMHGAGVTASDTAVTDVLAAVARLQADLNVKKTLDALSGFYADNFASSAYRGLTQIRLADLKIWVAHVADRAALADAVSLGAMLGAEYPVNIPRFFRDYLAADRKKFPFARLEELFAHSFLRLCIIGAEQKLDKFARNLTRNSLVDNLTAVRDGEAALCALNAKITAHSLSHGFDPKSDEFGFLRVKNQFKTGRALFKEKPGQILKLKPCLIMSPSTVSLLLRPKDYAEFDAVIFDEASQLTPEYVIPALYRAKQCVIVGDEHQMPIIRHFVRTTDDGASDDDDLLSVASVLDLVNQNASFDSVPLLSHYRSLTETLIDYSQSRYYKDLITFPSVTPRTSERGLFDVYVEDGICEGGVNLKEAVCICDKLREHFGRYFDEASGRLTQSVGVVTFGQKQAQRVHDLIDRDKYLSGIISRVRSLKDEVADKNFFIRTIENVQGHEMSKIILSLTYGRRENGKIVNAFGTLNRNGEDTLGEKVFNVAVTRAQSAVMLIHSVRSYEITVPSLQYIREYIERVERFDSDDSGAQFVTDKEDSGFISGVADYLAGLGIDRKRIVCNYGITENSVRIPIAVLSEDLTSAQLGVMCEKQPRKFDYTDYTVRYPDTLKVRGWTLYPVYIYDWIKNTAAERENLKKAVRKHVSSIPAI
ncbi:MAG: AAA family ATPase [Clostridiales bacterium]|nr:AAA family ATPase [Clostridiales bacterium]